MRAAPGAKYRLLHRVLGVLNRAQHPVAMGLQLAMAGGDQALERTLVAATGRLQQLAVLGALSSTSFVALMPRSQYGKRTSQSSPPMNIRIAFGRYV